MEEKIMQWKLTSLLVISLLIALLTPHMAMAQDFGPAFKAVEQTKREEVDKIRIEVTGDNFSVSLRDAVAGPRQLGTFPLRQWPAFIAEAVRHGLRKYGHYRYYGGDAVNLTFLSPRSTKLSTGKQDLNLPRSFFDYMSVVEEFPAQPGKNGFAILLYDPHFMVQGRYQLVPALNELVRANSAFKFKFLDEGEYEKEDRSIPFNGLDLEFKKLPAGLVGSDLKPALVYALLERYLIDCAMAYRLLYDDKMPSLAIDDNTSLAKEDQIKKGLDKELEERESSENLVSEIQDKVEEFLSARRNVTARRQAIGDELFKAVDAYRSAGLGGTAARDVAASYQKIAELLGRIVQLAEQFQQAAPASRLQSAISSLKGHDPFKVERAYAQNFAARDAVMADQIVKEAYFTAANTPIAFLGDGHLYGITDELRKKGVGYVVLSPSSFFHNYEDRTKFDRFVSPSTRADYLKEATQWNKGPVGPLASEVATVIGPFLKQGAAKFQSERLAERAAFLKQPDFTVDYDKVAGAAAANAVLTQARIEVETTAGAAQQPNVPPEAVAYFDPGAGAKRPRLVILEPAGDGWRGPSGQVRYDTLRNVPLPYSNDKYAGGSDVINFYELPGGQLGATVYHPSSGRTYIINGGPAAMGDMLTLRPNSKPDGSGNTLIRVLVVEIERKHERKIATDGE
jgi:hypothetical protein